MSRSVVELPDLVVEAGQTVSNVLTHQSYEDAVALIIYSPTVLAETATIEVSPENDETTDAMVALQEAGSDVTLTADKARVLTTLPAASSFCIALSVAAAAQRTFKVRKVSATYC